MTRAFSCPAIWRPSLSFGLLITLFAVLWLAGGTSRHDMYGQAVVRGVAWLTLILIVFFGRRPDFRTFKAVWVWIGATAILSILQLIPLPPDIWLNLPGRRIFEGAATIANQPQPWRPLSIAPHLTWNALSSLIIPTAVTVLVAGSNRDERRRLPGLILAFVVASAFVGLMQLSGFKFDNPLIDSSGQVSGIFANRNHFALLLAVGCLLTPIWTLTGSRRPGWRGPVAVGILLLLVLTILATGSRAGIILAVVALFIGVMLVKDQISRAVPSAPRRAFLVIAPAILVLILVLFSFHTDRAVSIERMLNSDPAADMRARALPTILTMIRFYFPSGTGLGTFDPAFRIHEPFQLLAFEYFNRAHNDYLEVALEAGLPGLVLMVSALCWWFVASVRAWHAGQGVQYVRPQLGSAVLLLIAIASIFDYPARTPIFMAIATIAACWLSDRGKLKDAHRSPNERSSVPSPQY